jgi:hypothetical protein
MATFKHDDILSHAPIPPHSRHTLTALDLLTRAETSSISLLHTPTHGQARHQRDVLEARGAPFSKIAAEWTSDTDTGRSRVHADASAPLVGTQKHA